MKFLLLSSTEMQSTLILYLLSTKESTYLCEVRATGLFPFYVKGAHVACLCYPVFYLVLV